MMLLILAQIAVAPAPADIQFHAVVDARSVRIDKQGEARLNVWANPDAGSLARVEAPTANGAKTMRNVRIRIDAEARIGAVAKVNSEAAPGSATQPPQQR